MYVYIFIVSSKRCYVLYKLKGIFIYFLCTKINNFISQVKMLNIKDFEPLDKTLSE